GSFHYGFRERVKHTAEARFCDIWVIASKVEKFEELAKLTPEELHNLTQKILDEYALTSALEDLRNIDPKKVDKRLEHNVQFCHDLLDYLDLDDTMKTSDVRCMELFLPRMLFCFHDSSSHNYTYKTLELINFTMRYCWLVNTTGHEKGFLVFDMLQEHNIRDLKVRFTLL
ncbi:hypothetical protein BDY19DRAFT_897009, partial [Irpex rosettiformis]